MTDPDEDPGPDEASTAPMMSEVIRNNNQKADNDNLEQNAQAGVRMVEATTIVWTKKHLIAAYAMIWLIYFVTSIQETVVTALNPYVTSAFYMHSLTAATSIVATVVAGLFRIPLAKILDTWGRPQGLSTMLFIWVVGYIMMAACKNVQTYAAAQVFSTVGSQGVSYCLTIFIADTSSLKNRSLMLSFASSPYIITSWVGGPISDSLLAGPGWRWGFGIFSIVVPVVVTPLCILFFWNQIEAKRRGLIENSSTKLTLRAVLQYTIDVDLTGIILLAGGMALFLLPFSLWSYQNEQWHSPLIICMIVFGSILLITFTLYEKFVAPVAFIPYSLLLNRTVFFGGWMFIFVFFQSSVWNSYFSSMLQTTYNLSVTNASYVSAIYRVGSCLWCLAVGVLIRWTGRFKWLNMYFAMPLMLLGEGLLIYFREAGTNVGYIVMIQIFIAFAGGTMTICGEMAMMAPSDHQHIAVVMAILDLFCSIGSSVGSAVASAIWTGTFPKYLAKYLPANAPLDEIYESLDMQTSYPMGSAIRDGINQAYSDSQRLMLITSMCGLAAAWVCVAVWRDIRVNDFKQTKGLVV